VLELDVMLKFRDLLIALGGAMLIVVGATVIYLRVRRRHVRLPFYVDAGGVVLSLGEERFLEILSQPDGPNQNLAALARVLKVDEITTYAAARLLKDKGLITEVAQPQSGSPKFELTTSGNDAALARGFIKLIM